MDLDVPGRSVRAGTVAGLAAKWIGSRAGCDVIEIEVTGYPQVNLRMEVLPKDFTSLTLDEMLAIGSVITAMPIVNAIPAVVAARPGIVTYADLPTQASRFASVAIPASSG